MIELYLFSFTYLALLIQFFGSRLPSPAFYSEIMECELLSLTPDDLDRKKICFRFQICGKMKKSH